MNTVCRTHFLTGTLCLLTALLAGCSAGSGNGLGDAGKQSPNDPQAVITPVGHVPTSDGTLLVRSGAEVVLSAKDSNGVDSAILGFSWSAANTAAEGVKILERGASGMSFRAPVPTGNDPLELRFRLTVRTADGDTGSNEMRVRVVRAPDPNDFLLSDVQASEEAVNLVLVAASYSSATNFAGDVPFTISVQKQVRYKRALDVGPNPSANPAANDPLYCASADPARVCVKIGTPLQLSDKWNQSTGVQGTTIVLTAPFNAVFPLPKATPGGAYQNPRFRLRPPTLNADEVNFAVLTAGSPTQLNATGVPAGDARRNNLLYVADIGDAEAEYAITLASSALALTGRRPDLLVFGANNADSAAPLTFVTEGIAAAGADVAQATVAGTAALNSMRAAGTGVVESRDTAAAYYAAIDPGSQRDTVDKWLQDNCFQPALAGRPGYYGADVQSTYLNDRDLGFGREMYFKTDCTTTQRATTGATLNTNAGERASIVFNYPSLEAAIKRSGAFLAVAMEYRADAAGGPKYTRFYTFAPDPRTRAWKRVPSANFDGRRERYTPGNCTTCHGGKPKASYASGGDLGATFIPWDANALLFADTDPSIVDARVKAGFTREEQLPFIKALNQQGVQPIINSRAAETLATGETLARWNAVSELLAGWYPAGGPTNYNHVPASWQGGTSAGSSTLSSATLYSQVFAENCRMCHMQRITEPDAGGAMAPAFAPQFNAFADVDGSTSQETLKLKQRVFEQHVMPASRLTSDRFWIAQPGATQSGAQVLAAHLGLTLPAATPTVTAATDQPPAVVEPDTPEATLRFSGRSSRLATGYTWTLERPAGSTAVLVGANTAEPALRVDQSGLYRVRLTVRDDAGNTSELPAPLDIVADRRPHAADIVVSPALADQVTVVLPTNGVVLGDGSNQLVVTDNMPNTTVTAPAFCTASGTNSGASCRLLFTAQESGTITYTFTDADGDASTGTVAVNVAIPTQWALGAPFNGSNIWDVDISCVTNVVNCTIDLFNLRTAALNGMGLTTTEFNSLGYTAQLSVVGAPALTGRSATTGSATQLGELLRYTSPAYFVSTQSSAATVTRDTFTFRVVVRNASNAIVSQSALATVRPNVLPRARWGESTLVSGVLDIFQAKCTACHGVGPAGDRGWGSLLNSTGGNADGIATYNQLRNIDGDAFGCPQGTEAVADACIQFGSAANARNSLLLRKPVGETQLHHYFKDFQASPTDSYDAGLTPAELESIRDWILDGAYRN